MAKRNLFFKKPRFSPDWDFSKSCISSVITHTRQVLIQQRCQRCGLTKRQWECKVSFECTCQWLLYPICQKFCIPRLEVAKDVTWWGRCIIIIWYPSLATRLQRLVVTLKVGNDKSSNLEAYCLFQMVTC
jgi:hypothetical protein